MLTEPANGTELDIVVFVGDGCNELKALEVDESDDEVRITAIAHRSGASDCNSLMQTRPETIRLEAVLGDRDLVGCKRQDGEQCSTVEVLFEL